MTNKGFSLNEIMVSLLIVSLLCGFAIPSYQRYLIKSRRTEAALALQNLSLRLAHYYNVHHSYCGADFKKLNLPGLSQSGYYKLNIERLNNDSFLISAEPLSSQAQDKLCGTLMLDSFGSESARGSALQPERDCW